MALDCVIIVKGHGHKTPQYGSAKNDQKRVVQDFITGVSSYYRAVFNHVKMCKKCDPQEVLEAYLSDRKRPKLGGVTSGGLAQLALRYQKQHGNRVSPKTVREFLWRIGTVEGLTEYASQLEPEEMVSGVCLMFRRWVEAPKTFSDLWVKTKVHESEQAGCAYADIFAGVYLLQQSGITIPPDRDELLKLATVAHVMAS